MRWKDMGADAGHDRQRGYSSEQPDYDAQQAGGSALDLNSMVHRLLEDQFRELRREAGTSGPASDEA